MKLIGELKEKVERAESKEEVREVIEKAGLELTDEELEDIAGGVGHYNMPRFDYSGGPDDGESGATERPGITTIIR